MGFWSGIVMAILGWMNPALAFFGSIVKYITSEAKYAGLSFLLDITGSLISTNSQIGDFIKDIALGIVDDAIEAESIGFAANELTPFSNLALRCEVCDKYTHYFAKNDGMVRCNKCLGRNLEKKINFGDKIYLLRNGLFQLHDDIEVYETSDSYGNTESLTSSEVFDFAFGSDGMDMYRSDAERFAERWQSRFHDKDFDEFRHVFSFAYDSNGLDLYKSDAQHYAEKWIQRYEGKDFDAFKEAFQFAYSSDGMDKYKSDAIGFAEKWIENHVSDSFSDFIEAFRFAYNSDGLDMYRSDAERFAFDWIAKHSNDSFERFKESFFFAYSPDGLNKYKSEAIRYAYSQL